MEALGLSVEGRGGWDYVDGRFTEADCCPVNLSGGLHAAGQPLGAVVCALHALAFKQLVGEPIGKRPAQKPPAVGVVCHMAGADRTSCVTTLRRAR
jgi:acetyl-CoA C-acetyltransferase